MSKIIADVLAAVRGGVASIVLLLVILPPWNIGSRLSELELSFSLALIAAVSMLVAASAGAYISRVRFLGPGVALSILTWYVTDSYFGVAVAHLGCGNIIGNEAVRAGVLIFGIGGAAIGAQLGRWFYMRSEENVPNAA